MNRFNTPEEVKEWAAEVAADDYRRHIEYGIALNPFSTPGAIDDWERGFNNLGPRSYERSVDFNTIYQRGWAAAAIAKEKAI